MWGVLGGSWGTMVTLFPHSLREMVSKPLPLQLASSLWAPPSGWSFQTSGCGFSLEQKRLIWALDLPQQYLWSLEDHRTPVHCETLPTRRGVADIRSLLLTSDLRWQRGWGRHRPLTNCPLNTLFVCVCVCVSVCVSVCVVS